MIRNPILGWYTVIVNESLLFSPRIASILNLRRHEPDPTPDRTWCGEAHELFAVIHELGCAPPRATPGRGRTVRRVRKVPVGLAGRGPLEPAGTQGSD